MAPASTTHRSTLEQNLQHGSSSCVPRSMKSGSDCKPSPFNKRTRQSTDWTGRLRSRRTATTIAATSPPVSKRKVSEDHHLFTAKRRKPEVSQHLEVTHGQTAKEKSTSSKLPDGVISRVAHQNSTCQDDEPKKRKQEQLSIDDLSDSGGRIVKRQKSSTPVLSLTQKNLRLFENSMSSSDSTKPRGKSVISSTKRSLSSTQASSTSSQTSRAYAAKDPRFEKELRDLNVDFLGPERLCPQDVTKLLTIMEKKRDSPDPDSGLFHETRLLVESGNETMVTSRLTPLLLPLRDLPRNNDKTKNLLYRPDTSWQSWGSVKPGFLPTPKPDLCILFKCSAFTLKEQKQMMSPYSDSAGFAPGLTCEVKTAMQGPKVADRQNANNMISALNERYKLLETQGQALKMERTVLNFTTAHDTRSQRWDAWFYVFDDNGAPKWCSHRIKHVNFDIDTENGFEIARRYNLNLCEYINSQVLLELKALLAKDFVLGPSDVNGAITQPNSVLDPGLDSQTHAQRESQTNTQPDDQPNIPPDDKPDDSSADPGTTSKRARLSQGAT